MDHLIEQILMEQEEAFREFCDMIADNEFEQMVQYYEKEGIKNETNTNQS